MSALHGLGRSGLVLLCAAAAASLLACAAPPRPLPEPPAAAAPASPPPPAQSRLRQAPPPATMGTVERYAWLTVIQLGEAFAAGDVDGFMNRVSRGFYRGYPALESALRALVAGSTERSAVVAVREVALEGERVTVQAQWERSVALRDGGRQPLAGETVFIFLKSETSLRLLDFRGDPPFGIEGIPSLP